MAWRDQLQQGKFREAAFFTESVQNSIGRRAVKHEYPLRDTPYIEDMGKKAREFTVDCFVLGDGYMDDRDALVKALETKGAGTLIHPYWGAQNVNVLDVTVGESSDQGRMARFSITFVEAGKNETPDEDTDTLAKVKTSSDSLITAKITEFAEKFGVKGAVTFVVNDAEDMVNQAMDAIATGQAVIAEVQAIQQNVTAAINNPLQLANDIVSAVAKTTDINVLKNLHAFGENISTVPNIQTVSRLALVQNRRAVIDLIKTVSIVETAKSLL